MLYPHWLNPGDNAWQLTAATLVGLMSVPGLVVLYGGVMQKRWSVNSMMLAFVAFALVLVMWVLYGFKMGFGSPMHLAGGSDGFFSQLRRASRARCSSPQDCRARPRSRTSARRRPRLPPVVTRLLPARLRGDHADPDAGLGARPGELQGVDPVRPPLGDLHLHRQRVPDLGRRLVRAARRGGLQRRLRHPSLGRRLRLRRCLGDRPAPRPRPRDRRSEQPRDGRGRRRPAVARLERLQRRRPVQRRRRRRRRPC